MMNSDSDSEISPPSSTRDIRVQQFADSVRSLHVDVSSDLARLDVLVRSARDDIRSLAQSLSGIDRITQKLQPPATEEAIGSLPTVKVTEVDFECAICLEMMVIGSEGKEMTNCKHVFHSECIDRWLRVRGSCPVCRCTIPAAADPVEDNINNRRSIEVVPSRVTTSKSKLCTEPSREKLGKSPYQMIHDGPASNKTSDIEDWRLHSIKRFQMADTSSESSSSIFSCSDVGSCSTESTKDSDFSDYIFGEVGIS